MKETDPTLGTHAGVTLRLEASTGEFYGTLGEQRLTDKTLTGLKHKIDITKRLTSREAAVQLPTVVLIKRGHYHDEKDEWIPAIFRGINAHTGEITITTGKVTRTVYDPTFFRADNQAGMTEVRQLSEAAHAAEKAHERAPSRRTRRRSSGTGSTWTASMGGRRSPRPRRSRSS